MKQFSKILLPMLVAATVLISACTGAAVPTENSSASKVQAAHIEFSGVIESIDGNQWVVDGKVIIVDPSTLRDEPFNVGDTVEIEGEVQDDGSIVVIRIESPADNENTNESNSNDSNSNDDNTNDDNGNDDNSNDENGNDDNSNDDGNTNDSDDGNSNDSDDSNTNDSDDDNSNDSDDDNSNDSDDDNSDDSDEDSEDD